VTLVEGMELQTPPARPQPSAASAIRPNRAIFLLIAGLILPSLLWCLSDRSQWAWDQSYYGYWSLATWTARRAGMWAWLVAGNNAVLIAPPLIAWLGQFFLPLRHLTGQFESALLLLNVVADFIALCLINAIARDLGCRPLERIAAILTCGGAGIFVALCHTFLVETLTCAATAFAVYVSLRADRMSVLRCVAALALAVSISFLAKASSMIFIAPLACYVAVSFFLARHDKRPPTTVADYALVIFACLVSIAAIIWYATNWRYVAEHFRSSTITDVALFWGSPVDLSRKIPYWIGMLSVSVSAFVWLSAGTAALIISALLIAIIRDCRQIPLPYWVHGLYKSGTLFALVLAGGVIMTVAAFSLQVNEDTRFLITTTPMIAILVAWALNLVRARLMSLGFVTAFAVNAMITHLFSAGIDPLHVAPFAYLASPDLRGSPDLPFLKEAIGPTCSVGSDDQPRVIAVSYRNLNANSVMFYSAQLNFETDRRCRYSFLPFASTDFGATVDFITRVDPPFIVTVDPARQPPPDFVNPLSKPLAEWLALHPKYERILAMENGFMVYRKAPP